MLPPAIAGRTVGLHRAISSMWRQKVGVGSHSTATAGREFCDERAVWILDEAL